MYDCYSEVSASQLKLDPFKETGAVDNMDTNRKMANSASEEFEKLYKVIIMWDLLLSAYWEKSN